MEDDNEDGQSPLLAMRECDAASASSLDALPAVIGVEGYLDAIALSDVNMRNVVASMGTALTLEQIGVAAEMGNVPGGEFLSPPPGGKEPSASEYVHFGQQ